VSLASSINVELMLKGKDKTSSEETGKWKGKFISIMTTLMHQYILLYHVGRI